MAQLKKQLRKRTRPEDWQAIQAKAQQKKPVLNSLGQVLSLDEVKAVLTRLWER